MNRRNRPVDGYFNMSFWRVQLISADVVAGISINPIHHVQSQQVLYRSIDASVRVRCFT
jgi:hypothetical protein